MVDERANGLAERLYPCGKGRKCSTLRAIKTSQVFTHAPQEAPLLHDPGWDIHKASRSGGRGLVGQTTEAKNGNNNNIQ